MCGGCWGLKKNLESKNSSEDQNFYVAVKPECNSNKGQYAQEKLAGTITVGFVTKMRT
jgi:hypothetical protein